MKRLVPLFFVSLFLFTFCATPPPPVPPKYITEVNFDDYKSEVLSQPGSVLVFFHAPWDKNSNIVNAYVEELARKYYQRMKFYRFTLDDTYNQLSIAAQKKWQRLLKSFGIKRVPALILYKEGMVWDMAIGLPKTPKERLRYKKDLYLWLNANVLNPSHYDYRYLFKGGDILRMSNY